MKNKLLAAIVGMGLSIGSVALPARAAVDVGDKPSVDVALAGGGTLSLEKLKGKIVLLDFWATWCGPCMAEAPHMVQVNGKYASKGLQIVGISLDQAAEPMLKVAKEKGFTWPQHLGTDGKVSGQFGVNGIPHVFLIGPDGAVLWHGHPASMDAAIEKAFKEHPPKLIDDKTIAAAAEALTKTESALGDNDAPAAIKALAAFPAGAKGDADTLARYEKAAKQLESAADKMLADVEPLIEQKQYPDAVAKLKDLSSSLASTPVGAKAKKRLAEVQAMPEVKKAVDDAAKASKSAEALATAQKLKTAGKNELAYPRFKAIVKEFPGTDAAKTAGTAVAAYEKDAAFIKRVNEQEAGVKAKGTLGMARAYAKNGKNDQARAKYQSIIADFPGTSFAETAATEMKALAK